MAVIPNGDELPQPQNYGNTLQEVLESWKESYFLMSKWRNGVLLLHYPDWFYGDDAQVAYTQIQDLRQSAEKNRGFLPIPLIANTFTKLNTSQLWRLGAEFPVLPVAAQSPLFKLLQEQPSLLSETGVTLNPHSSEELKKRYTFLSLLGESYTALRIHQREVKTGGETLPMLFLEVKTNTGVWAPVVGTNLLPRDPDFASPKKTGKK